VDCHFRIIWPGGIGSISLYCYAFHPELPGCISGGETPNKAKQNLSDARIDYIYYLLEDGLQVPDLNPPEIEPAPPAATRTPKQSGADPR
jgi:predicted RNase H-like HicB family nuclease